MPEPRSPQDSHGKWASVAVLAAVLCCAGPPLIVALGLGASGTALGAVLGKPTVLAPAVIVLIVAIALIVGRRRR